MKKIITTVGTSLFTNYISEDVNLLMEVETNKKSKASKEVKSAIKKLEKRSANEYKDEQLLPHIKKIKEEISKKWLKGFGKKDGEWEKTDEEQLNFFASAEITSLKKIVGEKIMGNVEVIFICSDTILSVLAAEILEENLPLFIKEIKNIKLITIEKLTVADINDFKEGLLNLVDIIDDITKKRTKNEKSEILLNISGGYKVLIPYLTILSMILKIDIYYIFEDSDELIKVPALPIGFDEFFLENIYFDLQSNSFNDTLKIQKLINWGLVEKYKQKKFKLTALGNFLKKYYKERTVYAKNVFGYVMEYKFLEYFYNTPLKIGGKLLKKIEKGVYINKKEIDIKMYNNDGGEKVYCFVEIKSIYSFAYNEVHVVDGVVNRIEKIKTNYPSNKFEYRYYLYHTERELNAKIWEKVMTNIKTIRQKLQTEIIRFYDVVVPKETSDDFVYENEYQQYVSGKIDESNIKIIGE